MYNDWLFQKRPGLGALRLRHDGVLNRANSKGRLVCSRPSLRARMMGQAVYFAAQWFHFSENDTYGKYATFGLDQKSILTTIGANQGASLLFHATSLETIPTTSVQRLGWIKNLFCRQLTPTEVLHYCFTLLKTIANVWVGSKIYSVDNWRQSRRSATVACHWKRYPRLVCDV